MRKMVAGITFMLAVVLFATSGWHRFQYRYCNAQRLNRELADSRYPGTLAADLEVDQQRERDELRQLFLGGAFLVAAIALWTGRLYPEHLFLRRHAPHAPGPRTKSP
jgi:hypothetical protein